MTNFASTSKSIISSHTLLLAMMAGIFLMPWQTFAVTIKAGPWLQAATETSIVIMWETDVSQSGKVEYGLSTSYGKTVNSQYTVVAPADDDTGQDTQAIIHEAKLTGLQPNTIYHYRVKVGAAVSEDNIFHTNKINGTYKVVHVSDTHTFKLGNTKTGLSSIIAYKPDYVILSGDIANTSINNDYRKHIIEGYQLWKNTVHYTVKGNHDDRDWTTYSSWFHNNFPGAFSEDFYSFDVGPVHYIGMNNNMRQQDFPPGSLDWLEKDLSESKAPWKVVFMKANPAITWDNYASKQVEFLMPIFVSHGVDLVLAGGNSDGFKRKVDGVWYIHAGLGHNNGYWTLEIASTGMDIDYHQADGTVTQSLSIGKPASPNEPPVAVIAAYPTTGKSPLPVTFDGKSSFDVDGHVVSYAWDFGDGVTATGEIVPHTYNTAGDYTATLTVTDEAGATDVTSVEITVDETLNGIDLVANGSFEAVDGDGQPVEWKLGSTQAWKVVSTEAFTGVRSLQLHEAHQQPYTPIASAMTVTLTPGTYTLGAWIATEALGVQDTATRGVRVTLKNEAITSGSGNIAATAIVQGTHNWHWVSTQAVVTKAGEYTVKIWAHGKPNGTAWIDAVSLIQE
jgi:PKD repeat protein